METAFEGWERYPENLVQKDALAYGYDASIYRQQLEDDSGSIFRDGEKIAVKVIELGQQDLLLENDSDLQHYLLNSTKYKAIRVFLIAQEYSWAPISISLKNVLRSFREKTDAGDDSYTGFQVQTRHPGHVCESTYIVKHVDKRQKEDGVSTWSIRQMGVYHRRDPTFGDTFVILNPSKSFYKRLRSLHSSQMPKEPWCVHLMLLSCANQQWRWRISDLEKEFTQQKSKPQLSQVSSVGISVRGTPPAYDICGGEVGFDDVQMIQFLQDCTIYLAQVLAMNLDVVERLQLCKSRIGSCMDATQDDMMLSISSDAAEHIRRVNTLLTRIDGTLRLVRSIVDFRALEGLRANGVLMNELAQYSREDNNLILRLTQKAAKDQDILKTLTFLTMTFLPISVSSSIMSMNSIKVPGSSRLRLQFEPEFWVFMVITGIFLGLTITAYLWWLRRIRARQRQHRIGP